MKIAIFLVGLLALCIGLSGFLAQGPAPANYDVICPSSEGKYSYGIDFDGKAYRFQADGDRKRPDGKVEFFVGDQVVFVFPEDG